MSKATIKLDKPGGKNPQTGVVFDLEHAKNLLRLEHSKGVKNWTITTGQPYSQNDGEIVNTTSAELTKGKA